MLVDCRSFGSKLLNLGRRVIKTGGQSRYTLVLKKQFHVSSIHHSLFTDLYHVPLDSQTRSYFFQNLMILQYLRLLKASEELLLLFEQLTDSSRV